ncbi:small ribosomal subunit protein cS22-like [Humulus lupulus]|uniref:small ribosomal subunit protein cS22-like n=1 Tax=Humulus lupulus TaxID=3486 RepID=UPI002B40887A|nr:small ribosomal subunit protein cS22-like [Humulus lupulus]
MASLRLLCSPTATTTCFLIERQLLLTPLSFPVNTQSHSYSHISVSCFIPCRFPLSHTTNSLKLPVTTNRVNNDFLLHFSSTSQEKSLESSPLSGVSESEELETKEVHKDKLYAENVPLDYTSQDVRALFQKYGTVVDVTLPKNPKNRGIAFVTMASPEEALAALNNLQSREVEGGVLKIAYCRKRREVTFNLFVGNLSFEATDKDLKEFFNDEGHSVVSTEVIFRETIQKSLVYGYVSFKSKKEAEAALISVQGKVFMGRPIRIERSKYFIRNRQQATESADSEVTSPELITSVEEA